MAATAPTGSRLLSPPAAIGAVLVAMGAFQVAAAVAVGLFDELGPLGALALRQTFGVAALALLVRPRWSRTAGSGRRAALVLGLVIGAMNMAFYLALDRAPLGVVLAIEMLGPLTVAALDARRRADLPWIGLAAVGAGTLALASGVDGRIQPAGIAAAVFAGSCWGLYLVLGRRLGQAAPGLEGLVWAIAVAACLALPLGIATAGTALLAPAALAIGAAIGVVGTALPYALELTALRTLRAGVVGLLMSLEPALGALVGRVVDDQRLSHAQVAGIALVGVATAVVLRRRPA